MEKKKEDGDLEEANGGGGGKGVEKKGAIRMVERKHVKNSFNYDLIIPLKHQRKHQHQHKLFV